jgi:hypothetical protein
VAEFGITIIAALVVLWTVGFFGTDSYGSYGYGDYKLNLLWPIISYGWSQLFPDLPHTELDYEGLSFLGIGILALLALALVTGAIGQLRHAVSRHWLPLTLMLLALVVFAFSNQLAAFDKELLTFPVPAFVEAIGAAFRSTGRFVWPLLYVVTIGAVVLVAGRLRAVVAVPLILAAFAVQAWDTAPKYQEFQSSLAAPSSTWPIALESPLWERAVAAGYDRIRSIPVDEGFGSAWQPFGYFAVTHGMDIDIAYLGRVDGDKLHDLRVKEELAMIEGIFEPKTIYVLDVRSSLRVAAHATPDDLIVVVDGHIVFLPRGAALGDGLEKWYGD